MIRTLISAVVTTIVIVVTSVFGLFAQVKLPAPIEAAFRKAYPTATIGKVMKEKEAGATVYEVESIDKGLHRDLIYKPDGSVVEIEEEIESAALPGVVATAVTARYPQAKVTTRERVTRGSVMTYELVLRGAKVKAATLSPDGHWISPKLAK